ncbi:MAG: 3-deoxy-manno-octulosonate cytidylyltransferase [Verrucomicrobiota bacterium]|nr:3-deoxy-manno-octulosonate cytidylyltransferase [Verrucomicrobiota bacterium]
MTTHNLPTIIVPARLASTRFPKKLIQEVNGLPLILHTANRLQEVASEFEVIFAVDGTILHDILHGAGFECIITDDSLPSGTDRIAQANRKLGRSKIINVQADEPLVCRNHITSLAKGLGNEDASLSTLATPFRDIESFQDPNNVKVVLDNAGMALYFSRSPIPHDRENGTILSLDNKNLMPLKHLGLYAYTKDFLNEFSTLPVGTLENFEKLEQLRALEAGYKISVSVVPDDTVGIDVPEDLLKLKK